MKITAFLLLVASLQISARGLSQGRVTIVKKNASLTMILKEISKQAGYQFMFDENYIDVKNISLSFNNATVEEVLDYCLKDQPFYYNIRDKIIIIQRRNQKEDVLGDTGGPPKTVRVTGSVFNESGEPLSGANVTIKESERGTRTNAKGEFDLGPIPEGSTVVFSFIGYAPEQVKITGATNLKIYLKVTKNELDKVVIQAYGTTTERLNTGSIATVTAAQIERQPAMNPLTALQGQVPGLVVTQDNGYASSPFQIELRGRSVINTNLPSEPLYIIDGVPLTILETGIAGGYTTGSMGVVQNGLVGPASGQSPFFNINPGDIESMTVLKDADATAIYGSRGANGVIIITTKRGKAGKTKFDVNVYQGESAVVQHYKMMNTEQYLTMRSEALKNDNVAPNSSNAYDLVTFDTTRYTDYQKLFWGNLGQTTDVQAGLSGGDIQTTFRLGGSYHRQTSILTNSGADQRGSLELNLSHKSLDRRLTISFTSMYTYTASNLVYSPSAVTIAPDSPPMLNSEGELNWSAWGLLGNQLASYAGNLFRTYDQTTGLFNSQAKIQYELFKGLSALVQLGYSALHNEQNEAIPIKSQNPATSPFGSAEFGNNNVTNVIAEPQLVYDRRISKGKLEMLAGGTYQGALTDGNFMLGSGYINDNLLGSIGNAGSKNATDDNVRYHYVAGFGRINYNWDDKYILNLSARRDGSSRFGPGKQFGNFGAVGAAWIFTEESWFKDHFHLLSFGKLRSSYGITGSDQIANYQYLTQWTANGTIPYNGSLTFVPTILGNANLQWETNRKLEVAMTLGFLKDRFTMDLEWYRNRVGDQLVYESLPYLTGFTSITANFPALIQNMGWESTVRAKIVDQSKFTWSANFNIGINRNKLVSFPGLSESPYAGTLIVGKPLSISPFLHYTGVDPLTGQYTFQSLAHNGTINPFVEQGVPNDLYYRDMTIKFEGGIGTSLRYKSLQLDVFFRFRSQTVPTTLSQDAGSINDNQSTLFLNRWQKPGDHAMFAKYTTEPGINYVYYYAYSDGVLSNGSYLRLQNLSITYDFQSTWVKKAGIQGCKVYLRGQNLFLLSKYEGIDPDVPSFGSLPPAKVVVAGLQFTL